MKRFRPLLLCLPCLFVLSACGNGRALMLFEQPWWDTLGNETRIRAALLAGAVSRGYLPRIVVVPPQERPIDRLLLEAGSLRRGAAVVGPLLSDEWRSFAFRLPETRFILVGSIGGDGLPPNVVVLTFDRATVLRTAGRAAAQAAGAAGGHAAVIVSAASELGAAETAAFSAGASEAPGSEAPPVRMLPAATDKAAVQAAIEEMHRAGAQVFLLGLGSLDPWALEVLKSTGGSAVVAGWSASRPFPDQVLLSVEQDVPAGVARALAAAARGVQRVDGPVTIVSGVAGSRR